VSEQRALYLFAPLYFLFNINDERDDRGILRFALKRALATVIKMVKYMITVSSSVFNSVSEKNIVVAIIKINGGKSLFENSSLIFINFEGKCDEMAWKIEIKKDKGQENREILKYTSKMYIKTLKCIH